MKVIVLQSGWCIFIPKGKNKHDMQEKHRIFNFFSQFSIFCVDEAIQSTENWKNQICFL